MKYGIDHIYILTTANAKCRLDRVISELARVGLITGAGDKDLSIVYGTRPKMFRHLIDNTSPLGSWYLNRKDAFVTCELSCTLWHYFMMQEAYERGFDRIMIVEDDELFVNDVDLFDRYMNDLSPTTDFALLDWLPVTELWFFKSGDHYNMIKDAGDGWLDMKDFAVYGNSGCTIKNRRAIESFLKLIESAWYHTGLKWADEFKAIDRWQDQGVLGQLGIKSQIALPHLCVQDPRIGCQGGFKSGRMYKWYDVAYPYPRSIDFSRFNLTEENDVKF